MLLCTEFRVQRQSLWVQPPPAKPRFVHGGSVCCWSLWEACLWLVSQWPSGAEIEKVVMTGVEGHLSLSSGFTWWFSQFLGDIKP